MVDTEGERVFFADVAAALIDDGQAIGVGILAKADVRTRRRSPVAHAGQILGGGLGRMLEIAHRAFRPAA